MTSMHLIAGFMAVLLGAIIYVIPVHMVHQPILPLQNAIAGIAVLTGLAFITITIVFNKALRNKKNNNLLRITEIVLFLALLIFTIINTWWMHAIYAAVGLLCITVTFYLELNAHKPEYITVDEKGVHLKKWNTKIIPWEEVKNFLIRHGNVTINLNNNTLYQYPAYQFSNLNKKEEMEQYAEKQIKLNAHKYQPDW